MPYVDTIPNEVNLEEVLFGTEYEPGVAVVPTARFLGEWSATPGIGRIIRSQDATGGYDRTSRGTRREYAEPTGSYTEDAYYETIASHFRASVLNVAAGDPVPGASGAFEYDFFPSRNRDDIATMTIYGGSPGLGWESTGVRWNEWTLSADFTGTEQVVQFSGTPMIRDVHEIPGGEYATLTGVVRGTSEVQTLSITGSPTGGTYTLTFRGQTTAPIAYNAVNTAIETALQALSSVGAGNALVTGTGPFTITFAADLANQDLPPIVPSSQLTGGTTPAVSITTATPGSGSGVLTVTGAGWTIDEHNDSFVYMNYGTHIGPVRQIVDTTATTLVLSDPALPASVVNGSQIYISGRFIDIPDASYHSIDCEGMEIYLDDYDAPGANLGDTLISDRVLSFSITQGLNLARKRRASGTIRRVGRGAREYSGIIRLELDRPDEYHNWRDGDQLSLRMKKLGDLIAATTYHEMTLDFQCIEIDGMTPDADNNNRTASFAFVALIPDTQPIFNAHIVNNLDYLP